MTVKHNQNENFHKGSVNCHKLSFILLFAMKAIAEILGLPGSRITLSCGGIFINANR